MPAMTSRWPWPASAGCAHFGFRAMSTVLFSGISELLTLSGAAAKDGRRVVESDLGIISRAAMVARGGRIVWVGPERLLTKSLRRQLGVGAKVVDFGGRVAMPAFSECHTHLVFAGDRGDEFERRNRGATY